LKIISEHILFAVDLQPSKPASPSQKRPKAMHLGKRQSEIMYFTALSSHRCWPSCSISNGAVGRSKLKIAPQLFDTPQNDCKEISRAGGLRSAVLSPPSGLTLETRDSRLALKQPPACTEKNCSSEASVSSQRGQPAFGAAK
jgi:hypothetical protein